jgi:solute carrier family 12 sodium/potassium/chloride transporter 2
VRFTVESSSARHVRPFNHQKSVVDDMRKHTFGEYKARELSALTKIRGLSRILFFVQEQTSQNDLNEFTMKARNWLKFNRIKAFYSQVDEVTFEQGAQSLMQATGLGKLRPNVLLMGYKSNWTTSSKKDIEMYFNTIQ